MLEVVQVVICSRKQKNVDDTLKTLRGEGIDCQGCACHVGSREHLKKLVKLAIDSYGRIDVLVSNAAVNPMSGAGPTPACARHCTCLHLLKQQLPSISSAWPACQGMSMTNHKALTGKPVSPNSCAAILPSLCVSWLTL